MSMFRNLSDEIKILNSDLNNVANCERAKKLRKKLLTIGLTMAIIGYVGVFVCFALFAILGFSSVGSEGFAVTMVIPLVLFMPFAILGGLGTNIAALGLRIVITGFVSKAIDDKVGNNCPKCNDVIRPDEIYCSKCGYQVKKECADCKTINTYKDKFCKKCGKEL